MDTQAFSQTVLSVALFLLGTGLTYLTARAAQAVEAWMTTHKTTQFNKIVTMLVQAAEQLAKSNGWDDPAKKKWVLNMAQAWCDAHHLNIDVTLIEATIESAINQGLQKPTSVEVSSEVSGDKSVVKTDVKV